MIQISFRCFDYGVADKSDESEATFFVPRLWQRWRNLNENHQDEFPNLLIVKRITSDSMLNCENVIETDPGQPQRDESGILGILKSQ